MSDPFIGEIKMVGFNFAPIGWAECDGTQLQIAQNTALFSLFGTYYGGDGRTTFHLPDLRGRFAMHHGNGPGLTNRNIGVDGGTETHTLTEAQLASHDHSGTVVSSLSEGDRSDPNGAYPARAEEPLQPYAGTSGSNMAAGSVQIDNAGGGQAVDHMPPFQALTFIVALVGIYPVRP